MNPFTQVHVTKDGKEVPIISMNAEHLVNTVNLFLIKLPQKALDTARAQQMSKYAPEGVLGRAAMTLGLKRLSPEAQKDIEDYLQAMEAELRSIAFDKAVAYVIVGLVRDDTRSGVLRIVQEATGITDRVELPNFVPDISRLALPEVLFDDEDERYEGQPGSPEDYGDQ